jgi:excisionase family DNA binding protein
VPIDIRETASADEASAMLTVSEAAARLRIERATVRLWIATKGLPAIRLGRGPHAPIRFRVRDLEAWIANQNSQEPAA